MADDAKPRVKKGSPKLVSRPRELTKEEIDYVRTRLEKSNAIRSSRGLDPIPMPKFK